jgi:hypothetical protein
MATLWASSPHFPSAQFLHNFSARPGNPRSFIVAGADEVTEVVLLAAVHMSLPGTTCAERGHFADSRCGGRITTRAKWLMLLARPARFELTTSAFGGQRSIQLSYGRAADVISRSIPARRRPPIPSCCSAGGIFPQSCRRATTFIRSFETRISILVSRSPLLVSSVKTSGS